MSNSSVGYNNHYSKNNEKSKVMIPKQGKNAVDILDITKDDFVLDEEYLKKNNNQKSYKPK